MESSKVKKLVLRCLPTLLLLVFTSSEADLSAQQSQNAFNKAAYEGQFETVRQMVDGNPSLDLDTSLIQALNGKHDEMVGYSLVGMYMLQPEITTRLCLIILLERAPQLMPKQKKTPP